MARTAVIEPAVATGLEQYLGALTSKRRSVYSRELVAILDPGNVAVTGARWVKVYNTERGQRTSIEAFVDPATGDVYKPDGMTRPARGIRGNIADPDRRAELLGRLDSTGGYLYARR